jgi:hypothetical protein
MIGMILDDSWARYYRRWKMYQDENCVEMNTCHKRKTCRMKTYFKCKKGLDKKKTPTGFKVEKKDINKKLECKNEQS